MDATVVKGRPAVVLDTLGRRVMPRRFRPVAEKRRIVQEAMQPGVSVAEIARRHGINVNLVFTWRRLEQQGLLRRVRCGNSETGQRHLIASTCVLKGTVAAWGTFGGPDYYTGGDAYATSPPPTGTGEWSRLDAYDLAFIASTGPVPVPLPPSAWLLLTGLLGLVAVLTAIGAHGKYPANRQYLRCSEWCIAVKPCRL